MWKGLPFKEIVYLSLVINIVIAVFIVAFRSFLPPVSPLLYGLPTGADQLVPSLWLLVAPASGLCITILNSILAGLTKESFIKKSLIISSGFVTLLLAITTVKIILLIGFF